MKDLNHPLALDIYLMQRKIGVLTLAPGVEVNVFNFTEDYIADPSRPTLSLSFKSKTGGLITKPQVSRMKVPTLFSNLLPEGHLRTYLAQLHAIHPEREFFLLRALGDDLSGGVRAHAQTEAGLDYLQLPPIDEQKIAAPKLRFSLAGVQLKFSALHETKGGLTIPATGMGGSWIVKLPSTTFLQVPENEYSMMELARSLGIEVPKIDLLRTDAIKGLPNIVPKVSANSLAVERFDRDNSGGRVHVEDFAQVFGVYPKDKYEGFSYNNIAQVLWLETGEVGLKEFIRRLVLTVAVGNSDMHLKNWSLIYRDQRRPELAPAYDMVSTIAYLDNVELALTLGRSKKMYEIDMSDFEYLASKAKVPEHLVTETAKETIELFHNAWAKKSNDLPLSNDVIERIDAHLAKVPLFGSKRGVTTEKKSKTKLTREDLGKENKTSSKKAKKTSARKARKRA